MDLLFFILVCYGLTQILVYGSIFNKIRPRHHFFHCPMCMGFWVGVFIYWLFNPFDPTYGFAYGCLSSGTSYALCQIFGDEGINFRTNKT
jgi:hypothetical protein